LEPASDRTTVVRPGRARWHDRRHSLHPGPPVQVADPESLSSGSMPAAACQSAGEGGRPWSRSDSESESTRRSTGSADHGASALCLSRHWQAPWHTLAPVDALWSQEPWCDSVGPTGSLQKFTGNLKL
jgi:hypothetical protein